VAIHLTNSVVALSGHCWHMDREVIVCYWKLWNVCHRIDDTFSDLVC
jgi:hypothetical protein